MTIQISESIVVSASPQEVLELVLDLETYRKLDPKIKKVKTTPAVDDAGHGSVKIVGGLWRLPPAPDTHEIALDRWQTLIFTGAAGVPARMIYSFTGRFEVEEVSGGTHLTHSYEIDFRQPFSALFEKRVAVWMAGELPGEMERIRDYFDPTLR